MADPADRTPVDPPRSGRWILALVGLAILTAAGLMLEVASERQVDLAEGRAAQIIPPRNDVGFLIDGARDMVDQRPYTGSDHNIEYPAVTSAQYLPFALLPAGLDYPLTLTLSAAVILATLRMWGGTMALRKHWLYALMLAPPVVSLIRLDQLNAAIGLALLTLAGIAQRRNRPWLLGITVALSLSRPTNAVPVLVALLITTGFRRPRLLAATILIPTAWLGVLSLVAYRWDPNWIQHTMAAAPLRGLAGLPAFIREVYGATAVTLMIPLSGVVAGLIAWHARGKGMSEDLLAGLLAMSVVTSQLGGAYVGVFALPAVIRVARNASNSNWIWAPVLLYSGLVLVAEILAAWAPGTPGVTAVGLLSICAPLGLAAVAVLLLRPKTPPSVPSPNAPNVRATSLRHG